MDFAQPIPSLAFGFLIYLKKAEVRVDQWFTNSFEKPHISSPQSDNFNKLASTKHPIWEEEKV